ncbi:MAG: hypothetical protein IT342_14245 [Candidatus Melainabacteria bacterium]|nr:hypothetical protein [Candidatus Melainabacteria bacterium]
MSEFETMLKDSVAAGQMKQSEMDDLLAQKAAFDANRVNIEATHKGKYVGYVNGEMIVADGIHQVLAKAKEAHPGKMTYFETVGSALFEEFDLDR